MDALEARRPKLSNPLARRIAAVGRETYNPGLGKQQGTTFTIYDTISLTGSPNVLNFFENLNNKGFPFTNLTRNSFTDAEAMVVQRAYLTLIRINNTTEYGLLAANQVEIWELDAMANAAAEYKKVSLAQASILVSGQEVLSALGGDSFSAARILGKWMQKNAPNLTPEQKQEVAKILISTDKDLIKKALMDNSKWDEIQRKARAIGSRITRTTPGLFNVPTQNLREMISQ